MTSIGNRIINGLKQFIERLEAGEPIQGRTMTLRPMPRSNVDLTDQEQVTALFKRIREQPLKIPVPLSCKTRMRSHD